MANTFILSQNHKKMRSRDGLLVFQTHLLCGVLREVVRGVRVRCPQQLARRLPVRPHHGGRRRAVYFLLQGGRVKPVVCLNTNIILLNKVVQKKIFRIIFVRSKHSVFKIFKNSQ